MSNQFGKIYNRIPKQVIGIQYFPYAPVPNVKHITMKVPEMPQAAFEVNHNDILGPDLSQMYAGAGIKHVEVCTHGEVLLGGTQKAIVKPADYVIYNQQTLIPIGVIPERDFQDLYTDKFELCESCLAKAQGLKAQPQSSDKTQTIPEIVELIKSGIGWDIGNGTIIKSELELVDFIKKTGLKP